MYAIHREHIHLHSITCWTFLTLVYLQHQSALLALGDLYRYRSNRGSEMEIGAFLGWKCVSRIARNILDLSVWNFTGLVWSLYVKRWGTSIAVLRFTLVERGKKRRKFLAHWTPLAPMEFFFKILSPVSNRIIYCSNFSWCFFCRLFIQFCVGFFFLNFDFAIFNDFQKFQIHHDCTLWRNQKPKLSRKWVTVQQNWVKFGTQVV